MISRTKFGHTVWLIALAIVLTVSLPSQAGRGKGRLAGKVVDEAGNPIANAKVRLEFEKGGLNEENLSNKNGEWVFIGLGTGQANLIASADGYIDATAQVRIQQLEKNPVVKLVLIVDKEKKVRIKDEASLQEIETGNQLYTEGKFTEALDVFQKFAVANPAIFQIHFNIGDCYRETGENDKAAAEYNLGLNAAREKSDIVLQAKALSSLGELFLRRDKFNEAQEYFKQSIALNPKDEILAYNVAEICFANNKADEALQYYQMAAQIKPEWSTPHLKTGYVWLNKGDIAKAIDSFSTFIKLDPQSSQTPAIQALLDSLRKAK